MGSSVSTDSAEDSTLGQRRLLLEDRTSAASSRSSSRVLERLLLVVVGAGSSGMEVVVGIMETMARLIWEWLVLWNFRNPWAYMEKILKIFFLNKIAVNRSSCEPNKKNLVSNSAEFRPP